VISINEHKKSSVVQKVDNKGFGKDLQGLVESVFSVCHSSALPTELQPQKKFALANLK
jgi:hypothetical protein